VAHFVICKVCGVKFDRDKIEAVSVGSRRYAHATCADGYEETQESKDLAALHHYLKDLFKENYDYLTLDRQIKGFVANNGFTYSGILKTLIYWYEIKDGSLEKAEGRIGIVPFCYKQAYNYYLAQFNANQINIGKDLQEYKNLKIREVRIKPPEKDISRFKLFNLDD